MSSLSPAPCPRGMPRNLAVCIAILLLTAACATTPKAPPPSGQDVFILLPDEQGKTGSIIVSGAGGERLLSEPRQAVTVAPGAAPGEPFVMPSEGVPALGGPVLAAPPTPGGSAAPPHPLDHPPGGRHPSRPHRQRGSRATEPPRGGDGAIRCDACPGLPTSPSSSPAPCSPSSREP